MRNDGSMLSKRINAHAPKELAGNDLESHSVMNTSDRPNLEAALQECEERFRLLSDISPIGVFRINCRGQCTYANRNLLELTGLSLAQTLGQDWKQAIHADDRDRISERWSTFVAQAALEKTTAYSDEYRYCRMDGSVVWVSTQAAPEYSVEGELIGFLGSVMDISDRKQAEAKAYKFVALADNSSDFIGMSDMNFVPFYLNPAGRHMIGLRDSYPLSEISVQDCFFPDDQDFIIHEFFPQVMRDGRGEVEIRFRHFQTDEPLWMIYSVVCIQDEAGKPIALATISRNITDRKHAELELREMSAALSNTVEGIARLDIQGRYIAVNEAYARMVGYTPYEMIGMSWQNTVHQDDLESLTSARQRMVDQGKVELEARGVRKDGSIFYKQLSMVAAWNERQELAGHYCFMKDISEKKRLEVERKRAEVAFQESEQRLRAILDNSPAAIYLHDPQNNFLLANRTCAKLFSIAPERLIGKTIYDVWPTDRAFAFASSNQTVLETGQLLQIEEIIPCADEIHTYITVKFPIYDASGTPYAVCGISTDITEKKQLETQFYHAQRLESLGTLASGIAHDLNNVFTPILGIVQLMPLKYPELDPHAKMMLEILETSTRRGINMVKQILTFARGTKGDRVPLHLTALLQEVSSVIEQTFPKSIEIRRTIPATPLDPILADSTHLHQILMNLCVNARDAMPNGGTLTLSVESCIVDQTFADQNLDAHPGSYVVITVADTGTGIPAKVRDHIFEPFFTTKTPGNGTGLGLSSTLGIVKNYDGFVQVLSEVGKGTQFKVYLPIYSGAPPEENTVKEICKGNGELVLVVDDDEAIRHINQSLLESYGYSTLIAEHGGEAIALYEQHQEDIKLVILDFMMPVMGGLVLTQKLLSINPNVKIIAISGLSSNREPALAAGATLFLNKPYSIETFLRSAYNLIAESASVPR